MQRAFSRPIGVVHDSLTRLSSPKRRIRSDLRSLLATHPSNPHADSDWHRWRTHKGLAARVSADTQSALPQPTSPNPAPPSVPDHAHLDLCVLGCQEFLDLVFARFRRASVFTTSTALVVLDVTEGVVVCLHTHVRRTPRSKPKKKQPTAMPATAPPSTPIDAKESVRAEVVFASSMTGSSSSLESSSVELGDEGEHAVGATTGDGTRWDQRWDQLPVQ